MSGEWILFSVVTAGVMAVALIAFFALRPRPTRLTSAGASGDSQPDLLLGEEMTDVLSRSVPGEERDREEILPHLLRAGMYSPKALAEYRAIRTVLIFIPLFAAAAIALLVPRPQIPMVALIGVIVAGLGYSLPRIFVAFRASSRAREIERGLPVFADMLSIALLAGHGLTGAMRRVTTQLRRTFPRMAEELDIVLNQTEMLNLQVALDRWAARSQITEVRDLALTLSQSQRLGNEVTDALMEYATAVRVNTRQRVDAKAQRASFWMLFPTLLCLWIPAAIVLVAPVYFEFAKRRDAARDMGGDPRIGEILRGENNTKAKSANPLQP